MNIDFMILLILFNLLKRVIKISWDCYKSAIIEIAYITIVVAIVIGTASAIISLFT